MKYRNELEKIEYRFLVQKEHLGDRIVLLTVSGSNAYGTNIETSDFDLRGISLEFPNEIIGLSEYEQYVDNKTDTTIFGFNKMMKLLYECNPNIIEILGLNDECILFANSVGKKILECKNMFLSKKCYYTFKGYATRALKEVKEGKVVDEKLDKQAAHVIRLLSMGIEILNGEGVHTNRKDRPDYRMIMDVRKGKYSKNNKMDSIYYEYVDDLFHKFDNAYQNSTLPEVADRYSIEQFMININLESLNKKEHLPDEESFMHFFWNNSLRKE